MRLIDADEFKRQIAGMAIVNNYPADKSNKMCELIDCQKTAYDVDKVLEQLENERNPMFRADGSLMSVRNNMGIDKAVEIVKSGGIE